MHFLVLQSWRAFRNARVLCPLVFRLAQPTHPQHDDLAFARRQTRAIQQELPERTPAVVQIDVVCKRLVNVVVRAACEHRLLRFGAPVDRQRRKPRSRQPRRKPVLCCPETPTVSVIRAAAIVVAFLDISAAGSALFLALSRRRAFLVTDCGSRHAPWLVTSSRRLAPVPARVRPRGCQAGNSCPRDTRTRTSVAAWR